MTRPDGVVVHRRRGRHPHPSRSTTLPTPVSPPPLTDDRPICYMCGCRGADDCTRRMCSGCRDAEFGFAHITDDEMRMLMRSSGDDYLSQHAGGWWYPTSYDEDGWSECDGDNDAAADCAWPTK